MCWLQQQKWSKSVNQDLTSLNMPVLGPPMGHPQGMGYHPGQPHQPQVYPPPPLGSYGSNGSGPPPLPPQHVSDHVESAKKRQDYEALCHIINQWNANRLDLFALSLPNEVRIWFNIIYLLKTYIFLRLRVLELKNVHHCFRMTRTYSW